MKQNTKIILIIIMSIFLAVILTVQNTSKNNIQSDTIKRPNYKEGSQSLELDVYTQGNDKPSTVEFEVSPRQYTKDEAMQAFDEIYNLLPDIIKADNQSLSDVSANLNLIDSIDGYMVKLEWFSSEYELIDYDGQVNTQFLTLNSKQSCDVELTVKMSSGEYMAENTFNITVTKGALSDEQIRQDNITRSLISAEAEQKNNENLILPESVEGESVVYSYKSEKTSPFIAVLFGIIGVVAVLLSEKEQKAKEEILRKVQLQYEYSELVSKLTLLIGAGMTIRGAWERITSDYTSSKQKKVAYEEMLISQAQLDNGISEAVVYENFGRRCNTKEYLKLGMLLEQNVKKGTKDLLKLLEQETLTAFEEHKAMARKKGEEAGTKLLIPMIIMLIIVMVIVMIPALMSFNNIS